MIELNINRCFFSLVLVLLPFLLFATHDEKEAVNVVEIFNLKEGRFMLLDILFSENEKELIISGSYEKNAKMKSIVTKYNFNTNKIIWQLNINSVYSIQQGMHVDKSRVYLPVIDIKTITKDKEVLVINNGNTVENIKYFSNDYMLMIFGENIYFVKAKEGWFEIVQYDTLLKRYLTPIKILIKNVVSYHSRDGYLYLYLKEKEKSIELKYKINGSTVSLTERTELCNIGDSNIPITKKIDQKLLIFNSNPSFDIFYYDNITCKKHKLSEKIKVYDHFFSDDKNCYLMAYDDKAYISANKFNVKCYDVHENTFNNVYDYLQKGDEKAFLSNILIKGTDLIIYGAEYIKCDKNLCNAPFIKYIKLK